jgi:hypothetical protein
MPYLNSRLHALLAMGLMLLAAPGLYAQEEQASAVSGVIRGDVDGDGEVTAADAAAVRAYLTRGTVPQGRTMLPAGDANADGRVTAADAALISRFAAGVDVSRFPVGQPVGGGGDGKRIDVTGSLLVEYHCTVSIRTLTSTCRPAVDLNGARGNVITGAPYVKFSQTVVDSMAGTTRDTVVLKLTMRNDSVPVIGTADGTTAVASQIFFKSAPEATASTDPSLKLRKLSVTPVDALGPASFSNAAGDVTYNGVKYYEITEIIQQGDSASTTATFVYSPVVTDFDYELYVATTVPSASGAVTISPADSIISAGSFVQLAATAQNGFGAGRTDTYQWQSSNPGVATVDPTGNVTGVAGGTTNIIVTSTTVPQRTPDTVTIKVFEATDKPFGTTVLGNVSINPSFIVTTGDVLHGATVTPVSNGATQQTGGRVDINADGTFTYNPPAGFEGTDSFDYTITRDGYNSTATVSLTVDGMVWFVDAAQGACASNCGRQSSPFNSLSAFNTANQAGGASDPANDEPVLLFEGAYTGPITLRNGQRLIGEDATGALATLAGITIPAGSSIPFSNTGAAVTIAGADGINLAQNNAVYGLTLNTTAGEAIGGSNFGTLTVDDVSIDAAGQALSLTTGTLAGDFDKLTSRGGTSNVLLSSVSTGSAIALGVAADSLVGASGDAVVITNGTGSFTYAGSVRNTATRTVNVTGKSGGAVTFSGSINPGTPGTGISVGSNTGGTVTFSGAAKNISSGTAAGVSLTTNTGATIAFTNGGLAIATTTGVPFTATGGGTVEVSGADNTIAASGAAANAVNLNGVALAAGGMSFVSIASNGTTTGSAFLATSVTGGSFTAGSLTVAGTTGGTSRGLALTTNSAPFTFTTATVNNTGAEGIYLNGNTGAVAVNGGSVGNTTNTAGDALFVTGGNAAATVAATLTKSSAGRIANITGRTGGTTTVSGTLSCTGSCTGINATGNTAGTLAFTAGTKTLNTSGSAAVTMSGNTNSTVNFTGGGLAITTTSGAGFSATTSAGGTLTVEGSNNTISTQTGTALTVTDMNIGGNGLTFRSITAGTVASGPANGIRLSNTGTSGFVTVTGDGSTPGSGGTIQRTTGANAAAEGNAVYLNGTRNVSLSWMNFNNTSNNGVYGTGVRGFTLNKSRFTASIGDSNNSGGSHNESAVQLVNVGGAVRLSNSLFNGAAYNAVRIENISGTAPALDSLVIVSDTVTSMQGNTADVRGTALLVNLNDGTADTRIRDNRVTAWWGNAIHVLVQGTASGTSRITNNFVDNTNGALAGAGGIWITGGNHAYNISSNTVRHTNGSAISADRVNFGTNMNGTIDNNTIGVSGDNNSGTAAGAGIFASHHGPGTTTTRISNNVIRQTQAASGNGAIWVLAGDAAGFGGSGAFNATLVGNNIQENGTPAINATSGILATIGTNDTPVNDTDQVCLDIGGSTAALRNTITNFNSGTNRIRVNQRFGTTSRFPGYTGAQLGVSSQTDLASYLLGRNNASTSVNANTSTGGFNNTSPAGSACPQPTL